MESIDMSDKEDMMTDKTGQIFVESLTATNNEEETIEKNKQMAKIKRTKSLTTLKQSNRRVEKISELSLQSIRTIPNLGQSSIEDLVSLTNRYETKTESKSDQSLSNKKPVKTSQGSLTNLSMKSNRNRQQKKTDLNANLSFLKSKGKKTKTNSNFDYLPLENNKETKIDSNLDLSLQERKGKKTNSSLDLSLQYRKMNKTFPFAYSSVLTRMPPQCKKCQKFIPKQFARHQRRCFECQSCGDFFQNPDHKLNCEAK
jgi:hypothetical protein